MKPRLARPIILFLVVIGIIGWLIIETKNISIPRLSFTPPQTVSTIKYQPEEKNGEVYLSFGDLDYLINNCCGSTIYNVKTSKTGEEILAKGKAKYPYPTNFEARIGFSVKDQKLIISINYLKIGKIESPTFLDVRVSSPLQKFIDNKINKKYKLKNVKITSDGLTIELI